MIWDRVRGIFVASALALSPQIIAAAECIAPSSPGGGWDFTCRQVGSVMFQIGALDAPMRVTNMAGGGGGLAFGHVVKERADDAELIIAASRATATRLAQGAYSNMTADRVRFLGAIAADPNVIVVRADSPYRTLRGLVEAVKRKPREVTFTGRGLTGGFAHLSVLEVMQANGMKDLGALTYTRSSRSFTALAQLNNGFASALIGGMSELRAALATGRYRALAVLTSDRIPGFEQIPTAKEQGTDVVAVNWRGFYVPKDIDETEYTVWAERLRQVAESEAWQRTMAVNGLAPFTVIGAPFEAWVTQEIETTQALSRALGVLN